ncbi:MAG: DMT family transporter [Lachnospiraceae bacterium]|jgi:drug/metabolite transporter (DMT)-like permease|nr:DMT family transporter [Lachnospiraceae bacterium]GFI15572.1 putative cystine transporter YijE [Lachnospiraceae bacterium]
MKKVSLRNSFLLFLAAFIWGVAFVAQSVGMDYMGPFSFNGARFLMGSMVLLPLVIFRRKKNKEKNIAAADLKITLKGGVCCGLALGSAALLQQFGIMYTTVGKAGFITTLYIIIVPVLGIFLGKKIPGKVWTGAAVAAFGMYLLCMSERLALGKGDTLVFLCAIIFSIHILVIDYFSPKADGVELSCIQFLTAGMISSILAFIFEKPELSQFVDGIIPLAYAGIMSSGVAYTLQVVGQKDMDPTVASLILSLESVVSMLAGWVILGQSLNGRELAGCGLVFGAVILVQLPEGKHMHNVNERDNSIKI